MPTVRTATDTRERILAAALPLFAQEGPEGLGIRRLAAAAKVNLAAVNYHFGSKQALFREVCLRRLRATNDERDRRLVPLETARGKPSPEAVLRAYLGPVVEAAGGDPAHLPFLRVVMAQVARRDRALEAVIVREERPATARALDLLARALPDASRDALALGLAQAAGATAHLLMNEALSRRISGRRASGPADLLDALVLHAAAGLRALAR